MCELGLRLPDPAIFDERTYNVASFASGSVAVAAAPVTPCRERRDPCFRRLLFSAGLGDINKADSLFRGFYFY